MLTLPSLVALSVVAFFAYAGIMESFSRGMHVAATYKYHRPTRNNHVTVSEPVEVTTPINNNEDHINISSTIMPTLNGRLQRVDLCHLGNVIVPLSPHGQPVKELTLKSIEFPFKRLNPLVCSWNVKVTDNCRRGLVTMKINERSRLSGEKGCTKGYYRVSPFMNEAKICGRINNVPSFQWYVEDQQPENVTITLKHNGLNDGYSEGLGFTLSGECVSEDSNLTISKAIKSYKSWLDQLSRRATGGLTVVLPVSLFPVDQLMETQPNVTKGPIEFVNVTSDVSSSTTQKSISNQTDISTDIPIATSPFTQPQTNGNNKTDNLLHLSITSDDVTDSLPLSTTTTTPTPTTPTPTTPTPTTPTPTTPTPTPQSIRISTARPIDDAPEIPWLSHSNHFPIIRRRPLPTTQKPITRATTSRRPTLTMFPARKRPIAQLSSNDHPDIPWLILKSPAEPDDPSLSEMYRTPSTATPGSSIPYLEEENQRPVIRRPLVRFPSTTVRPVSSDSSSNPWVILKSPQTNKETSTSVYPPKKPIPTVKNQIPPASKVPIVDNQGIPWLILKSPDPQPSDASSSEIYYPDIPSNKLKKRHHLSFPGYFISTTS